MEALPKAQISFWKEISFQMERWSVVCPSGLSTCFHFTQTTFPLLPFYFIFRPNGQIVRWPQIDGQPADQNMTVDGIFCYKQTTSVFL